MSDEPVGRSDEPAAEAGAEPDAAEAPPAEELRAEEAPVTAADDEPAAAAASPADEEHDPETDEIHPAGAPSGSAESSCDDVHPQDGAAAAGPGPAPPAGAGDAGVSDEPVGRSDEPAAGAGVEPDMAKASPADEPPAEQAPVTAAHDKPAAAAVTPAGEEYDPETGEIAPAGPQSGATQSFDDDIGLGDERAAAEAGPEPTARASDAGARDEMASRVVDEIVGQVQSAPGEGRLGPGTPTTDVPHDVPGNGEQRPADRLGDEDNEPASQDRQSDDMTESRDPEIPPGGDRQRAARGSAGPEETPPDVSGRSRTANVKKAMAGAVRRVARLGGKGGAENPAGGEAEGSAPDPREPPRSDAPAEADPTVARDPQRPPFREDGRMAEMRQRTAALEEKEEAAKEFSDQTVAAFAKNLDAARAQGDRIEAMVGTFGPRLDALSNALSVSTVDARRQKRRRLVRTALGAALLAAVGCAGGAAVQSQFPLLPQADPSLGWRDHIWNHYGSAFTACYDRARKDASGRVKCEIEVRGR